MKNLNQETCSKSSQNGLVTEDELDIEEAPGADESDLYTNDESIYATFQKSSPKLDSLQLHLVDIVASGQLPLKFKVEYLFADCRNLSFSEWKDIFSNTVLFTINFRGTFPKQAG